MFYQASKASIVLLIGSGPDALNSKKWSRDNLNSIVAINNAWQIREDWDYLIYPDDLPKDRLPSALSENQQAITSEAYIPSQNHFGGVVYAGATMAFTAAYWALHHLKPTVMAFVGCDMVYPKDSKTHFYGKGTADPLRDDITLQNLESKSIRLYATALENNCLCVNLTTLNETRLTFPKVDAELIGSHNKTSQKQKEAIADLDALYKQQYSLLLSSENSAHLKAAQKKEKEQGLFVESGKYWQNLDKLDKNQLKNIDDLWLKINLTNNGS